MGLIALCLTGFHSLQQRSVGRIASPREGGLLGRAVTSEPEADVQFSRQLQASSGVTISCETSGGDGTFPELNVEPQAFATIVQLAIMLWMFLGLAIVCDQFFEAALSRICEAMSLKDDVAGATWMAAGGSAPELATSILGVFISRSDVGFGTIVGSAVFNVLFVIGCCAFVAPNLKLTWWPLARDCSYYCFSMAILVFVIADLEVHVHEAIILLLLYGLYVTIMYYNERLEIWVTERVRICQLPGNPLQQKLSMVLKSVAFGLVLYPVICLNGFSVIMEMIDDHRRQSDLPCVCEERQGVEDLEPSGWYWLNFGINIFFVLEMLTKYYAYGFFGYWGDPLNCFDGALVFLILIEFILTAMSETQGIGVAVARMLRPLRFVRGARLLRFVRLMRVFSNQVAPTGAASEGGEGYAKRSEAPKEPQGEAKAEEEEEDDDEPFNPFEIPESVAGKFFWLVGFPLSVGMYFTIPDCRREMFKNWWLGTFAGCILWIGSLSYFMVWMVTEFGNDAGIPETVMGVTLLAAGTSIPDCLSSIAVARRGHGDMAVSSSIGSNIFDILIGLPFPWFMYTAILYPALGEDLGEGSQYFVPIQSSGLAVMILSLFVMVALVVTTIHISGWVLSTKLGGSMIILYCFYLALSLLIEYDVILPPCDND